MEDLWNYGGCLLSEESWSEESNDGHYSLLISSSLTMNLVALRQILQVGFSVLQTTSVCGLLTSIDLPAFSMVLNLWCLE